MVTDLLLAQHLAHLGIEVQRQRRTDRTVIEMGRATGRMADAAGG